MQNEESSSECHRPKQRRAWHLSVLLLAGCSGGAPSHPCAPASRLSVAGYSTGSAPVIDWAAIRQRPVSYGGNFLVFFDQPRFRRPPNYERNRSPHPERKRWIDPFGWRSCTGDRVRRDADPFRILFEHLRTETESRVHPVLRVPYWRPNRLSVRRRVSRLFSDAVAAQASHRSGTPRRSGAHKRT